MKLDPELRERILAVLQALNLRGLDPHLAAEVQAVMKALVQDRVL
jgi:ABC-type polar amino acid transport system ATPase subunit